MASSKDYLNYVLDRLSMLDDIKSRPMMGEFIIYYQGKVIGGIYDDRFLIKQTPTSKKMLPDAPLEIPYPGGKEMIPVENIDDRAFLCDLFCAMIDDLPAPKKR